MSGILLWVKGYLKPSRVLVLTSICLLSACATNPVSGKKDFVLMSEAQEIALGRQSHPEILKQYEVYKNPKMQAMVDRIGQKLAAQSHRSHLKFTFTLLDSPEVNAFALPGGYIYITRGIMAYLNSEEELAGVLGHEIGHVTARHGVKQQSAQTTTGVISVLAAVISGNNQVAKTTSTIGSALVSGYGRNHELQADRLGAEYLAKINYQPESMLGVIGVLKNQELFAKEQAAAKGQAAKAAYHGVFSSHPDNDSRLQAVVRAAKKFQTAQPIALNPDEFLKTMQGMVFADSEAQGIIKGNDFYHSDLNLHLKFPKGWSLQNQPDRLVGISPDQKAMIQFVLGDAKASDPKRYLFKTFPDLSSGKRLSANGYSGATVLNSPWGKRGARVAAVKHDGKLFVLMAVGANKAPNRGFFKTVASLKPLSRNEKKLAKGKQITLIRAKRGDTFAGLAKQSNLDNFAESQLRLLNGLYPAGEPKVGQLIKIVK